MRFLTQCNTMFVFDKKVLFSNYVKWPSLLSEFAFVDFRMGFFLPQNGFFLHFFWTQNSKHKSERDLFLTLLNSIKNKTKKESFSWFVWMQQITFMYEPPNVISHVFIEGSQMPVFKGEHQGAFHQGSSALLLPRKPCTTARKLSQALIFYYGKIANWLSHYPHHKSKASGLYIYIYIYL